MDGQIHDVPAIAWVLGKVRLPSLPLLACWEAFSVFQAHDLRVIIEQPYNCVNVKPLTSVFKCPINYTISTSLFWEKLWAKLSFQQLLWCYFDWCFSPLLWLQFTWGFYHYLNTIFSPIFLLDIFFHWIGILFFFPARFNRKMGFVCSIKLMIL